MTLTITLTCDKCGRTSESKLGWEHISSEQGRGWDVCPICWEIYQEYRKEFFESLPNFLYHGNYRLNSRKHRVYSLDPEDYVQH